MFENSMNRITSYPKLSKKSCLGAYLRSFQQKPKEKECSGSSKRQVHLFAIDFLTRRGCILKLCNFYQNVKSSVTKGIPTTLQIPSQFESLQQHFPQLMMIIITGIVTGLVTTFTAEILNGIIAQISSLHDSRHQTEQRTDCRG